SEEHSHAPDSIAVLYRKPYEKIKQRVLNEFIPVMRIVEYEYCGYKKEGLAQMPTIVTTILTTTFEGQQFLVHSVTHDDFGSRLCIFTDPLSFDILFESHNIASDGTFKSCTLQFEQLYIILGFELDQVATELPKTIFRGCLFDHGQACYREIQQVGVMNDHNDGCDIHQFLRQFLALPLLPLHFVQPVFDELKKQAEQQQFYDDRLKLFILYLEAEWMQRWGPVAWCGKKLSEMDFT
ncbi:unnamed protein product, partial [Didymodactylos carnosus]